jgi:exopolysaccharide biosynthesis polyprenyl glycosylphosphotransferase
MNRDETNVPSGGASSTPMTVVEPSRRAAAPAVVEPRFTARADSSRGGRRDWVLTAVLVTTDTLMIALALYTSWAIRYVAEIGPEIEEPNYVPFSVFAPLLAGLIPISVLTFATSSLYRQRRGTEWFDDIPAVVRGTALATMAVFAGVALLRYPATSRLTFILAWALAATFVVAGRALVQLVATLLHRHEIGVERVMVVGGNNLGRIIMQSIAARGHLGYQVIGFVDDDRADDFGRFRHLGGLDDVERLAESERIDHVIVALPSASHAAILRIVDHCRQGQVSFKLVPDLYEMSLSHVDVDTVSGIPLIGLKDVAILGWNALTKRAIDIAVSALALLALSPILAAIALLIKLESRGPIVYRHTRIGKHRQPFTMFKFRSMRQDADRERMALVTETDGDRRLFKDRDDPRRTRVGAFIRRWSLDELPQFWNVLIGDMSVVGPRPQIPPEVATYEDWHYNDSPSRRG